MFNIKPVQILNKQATQFEISSITVQKDIKAIWSVMFYDEFQNNLYSTQISIEGQEYLDWGSDDEYIILKTIEKLGLEKV